MDETYVPGLNKSQAQQSAPYGQVDPTVLAGNLGAPIPTPAHASGAPVVGFLYSLSRNGEPEYWPLTVGQNTIGNGSTMDICLGEASVSNHHANINIKRMKTKGNALVASIQDVGSKNGIMLNDEELDYDLTPIKNEDVVTFGNNYKCVIMLIDPVKYGLSESAEFIATAKSATPVSAGVVPPTIPSVPAGMPAMPQMPPVNKDPFSGFNDNNTLNVSGGGGFDLGGGKTQIL